MAATTAGLGWPSSSPIGRSPDEASPIYPNRPIRPLPKRRLRTRLSSEQADAIVYPPTPPTTTPLFTFPYSQADKSTVTPIRQHTGGHDNTTPDYSGVHSDLESEADEDEQGGIGPPSPSISQHSRSLVGGRKAGMGNNISKPESISSSVDGYDSFENTNNKKKRKIPNMGGPNTNLSAEMASMGLSSHGRNTSFDGSENGGGHYYGSPSTPQSSGTGISGAGRGRFGRSSARASSERRPLGASTSALNAYANGHNGRARRNLNTGATADKGAQSEQGGIISTAIANAHAEQVGRGDENVSLLQQASKTTPQKTQFTFTCGSDSANKMVWPGQNGGFGSRPEDNHIGGDRAWTSPTTSSAPRSQRSQIPIPVSHARRGVATHGTQTSPNINGNPQQGAGVGQGHNQQAQTNPQAVQQPKKPRRRPGREYQIAARQRRLQQEYANYHHPPSREDIWICEFCEYESIFGTPPEALVRQYEIKDRKERKRLAEKRRLLEKARMKGRKGKKASKASKNAAANQQAQHSQAQNQRYDHTADGTPIPDSQGEDYFEDEFDDVPPTPPPSSANGAIKGDIYHGHGHVPHTPTPTKHGSVQATSPRKSEANSSA